MTDFYLLGPDANNVNQYYIHNGSGWVHPPTLPGPSDRAIVVEMETGSLNVSSIIGWNGILQNPVFGSAVINGGTVVANSAPEGISASADGSSATITINGTITNTTFARNATISAQRIEGPVTASVGSEIDVAGAIAASGFAVTATNGGRIEAGGGILASVVSVSATSAIEATSLHNNGGNLTTRLEGGTLRVGDYNIAGAGGQTGQLDILGGGVVTVTGQAGLGRLAGDRAGLEIADVGSRLAFEGTLTLGDAGFCSVRVRDGAIQAIDGLVLGRQAGGDAFVQVLSNARLNVEGDLTVADGGHGTLNVNDARATVGGTLTIGKQAGSNGSATVANTGPSTNASSITAGSATVGDAGSGRLTATDGGKITVREALILGAAESGNGGILLSDAESRLTALGTVTVGEAGKGTIEVREGAHFEAGEVVAAADKGSTGELKLNGEGSLAEAETLVVGQGGTGKLIAESGTEVSVSAALVIGGEKGSKGEATLDEATLLIGGDATVGAGGAGTLLVNVGETTVLGDSIVLAEEKGSKGVVTVNGGRFSFGGELTISVAGKGTMTLNQGAKFQAGPRRDLANVVLGEANGGTGKLNLGGRDTSMELGELTVGVRGQGTVSVKDGAALNADIAEIGSRVAANANSLTVEKGGHFAVAGELTVGGRGVGALSVKSGGEAVVAGEVVIGGEAGAIGSASVSGKTTGDKPVASTLRYGGTLTVGEMGSGELKIDKGALVAQIRTGDGIVEIAAEADSTGKATVSGKGSALKGKVLSVGGTEEHQGGSGTLTISDDAKATFARAEVWKSGKIVVDGGTFELSGALAGHGKVEIKGGGTFELGGNDKAVAIVFAGTGTGETLTLASAGILKADVKGFGAGDEIAIGGLSADATFTAKLSGGETLVTFTDQGQKEGTLHLLGKITPSALRFDADTGTLSVASSRQVSRPDAPAYGDETVSDAGKDTFVFNAEFDNATGLAQAIAQHLVHHTADGALPYDPDGGGPRHAILFAALADHPHLTADDFQVV